MFKNSLKGRFAKMMWADFCHAWYEAHNMIQKGQLKFRHIPDFLLGTWRKYQFLYAFPWKMRSAMEEAEYFFRFLMTDPDCYRAAACNKHCGCSVPGLEFTKRGCEGDCMTTLHRQNEIKAIWHYDERMLRMAASRLVEWPIVDVRKMFSDRMIQSWMRESEHFRRIVGIYVVYIIKFTDFRMRDRKDRQTLIFQAKTALL